MPANLISVEITLVLLIELIVVSWSDFCNGGILSLLINHLSNRHSVNLWRVSWVNKWCLHKLRDVLIVY
jgi:hypothetical protein